MPSHEIVKKAELYRAARYLGVGLVNTGFGYAVFAVTYGLTRSHVLAVVVGTVCGVVFNYFSTGRLVFANRGLRALPAFCVGYGVVLAANLAIMEGLVRVHTPPLLAQAIATPFLVVLGYFINAAVVFRAAPAGVSAPRAG